MDSALEARTTALASELRCPVCQGNSIQDSPSELAQQMRDLIRDQLRAGKTPDDVRAYFVAKYGEWILLSPKAEGFNMVVYLIPLLVILGGGAVVWRSVRRWTTTAAVADQGPRDT
jgi:cytochrome c-type biogenesis protein CcmH